MNAAENWVQGCLGNDQAAKNAGSKIDTATACFLHLCWYIVVDL